MTGTATRFLQLDVFTPRAGGGNPLGVVIGAEDWGTARMQAFARWTDLVETTFLLPPTGPQASYRVRIFTPDREIPFAGHPSIGTAHAFLETGGRLGPDGLVQECGAGLLPIRVAGEGDARELAIRAPAARAIAVGLGASTVLRDVLEGVALGTVPPALIEGGRRWWIAEFANEPALRAWRPDLDAIRALAGESGGLGLAAFARSRDPDFDLVVRAFPLGVGIVEDPASGAANGLIGAWIAMAEPDGPLARGYRVSQGRELGRDARLRVTIESADSIWVGGQTRTVIDGALAWPD
jgi:PhzF family phenazine biosynthesis protein